MENKKGQIFMFSIVVAILGSTLYKKFDFETNTFEKPALAIVYGIVVLMSIFFIVKNLVNKNRTED